MGTKPLKIANIFQFYSYYHDAWKVDDDDFESWPCQILGFLASN